MFSTLMVLGKIMHFHIITIIFTVSKLKAKAQDSPHSHEVLAVAHHEHARDILVFFYTFLAADAVDDSAPTRTPSCRSCSLLSRV